MLRRGDEAQGGEAASLVGLTYAAASPTTKDQDSLGGLHLTPRAVVGRPAYPDARGRLAAGEPSVVALAAGRVVDVVPLGARDVPPEGALGDADALLLPALADPHLHLVGCAGDAAGLDLAADRPRSLAVLLARLSAAADALPDGAWLRVGGHDEAWLAERRQPTLAELDAAVPCHPLRLRHATRHASLLNSPARARVERALGPLPSEGPLVHGREEEISRVVGPLDAALLRAGLARVGRALADRGVVVVDDVTASNDAARVALLADAVARGVLPQRVRAYVGDAGEVSAARAAAEDRVAVLGVKLLPRTSDEVRSPAFRNALARARRRGVPVAVHAVEADVTDAVLDALAAAPPRAPDVFSHGVPDRIEHASLCPPELALRIARAGVAVVTQPAFLAARGVKYAREVEPALWPWLYPLRSLLAAGVPLAASSDAPVGPLDPWLGFEAALRRTAADATVLRAEERLTEADALELFRASAGSLAGGGAGARSAWPPAPGRRADLLLADTTAVAREGWTALRVRATLAAGRVIGGAGW